MTLAHVALAHPVARTESRTELAMTPEIVRSVVQRHLKSTMHFTSARSGEKCPVEPDLMEDEEVVGWYTNPPGEQVATLVFTTRAIHVACGDQTKRLDIDTFESCAQPASKVSPKGLSLMASGERIFLPAAGSFGDEGQFKDAYVLFSVLRALLP